MSFVPPMIDTLSPQLVDVSANQPPNLTKEEGKLQAVALMNEIKTLQSLMYGAATHRVLLILQGLDASGKDGVVRFIMGSGDPLNCVVQSFKLPTPNELAHDFLWRVHAAVPNRGVLGVFNRSHYEDVVAQYARGTIDDDLRERRVRHIQHFEELLHDDGTIIIKCFLHIDADEQAERLLAREQALETAWKLSADDWKDRRLFGNYLHAYDTVMRQTSNIYAPWYVVPANRKWYRNLVLASLLHHHMEPYRELWSSTLRNIQESRLAAIEHVRSVEK
ncbi:MAG: PPK2 family polyphosphate kinase [Roseiflexaceae bacterium]